MLSYALVASQDRERVHLAKRWRSRRLRVRNFENTQKMRAFFFWNRCLLGRSSFRCPNDRFLHWDWVPNYKKKLFEVWFTCFKDSFKDQFWILPKILVKTNKIAILNQITIQYLSFLPISALLDANEGWLDRLLKKNSLMFQKFSRTCCYEGLGIKES